MRDGSGRRASSVYGAAKAGLIGFTKSLAREEARHGIRVNCISPGLTDTPQFQANLADPEIGKIMRSVEKWIPLKRFGQPEEIAKVVSVLRLKRFKLRHRPGAERQRRFDDDLGRRQGGLRFAGVAARRRIAAPCSKARHEHCRRFPPQVCTPLSGQDGVIDGDVRLTYRELARPRGPCAAGIQALGIKPGDRISIMATIGGSWWLPCWRRSRPERCGATQRHVSPWRALNILAEAGVKLVLTTAKGEKALEALRGSPDFPRPGLLI